MAKILESSAERRLQAFRRELTLDLFTRHGPFWDRVARVRRSWAIAPAARIPPPLLGRKVHRPPGTEREFLVAWPPEAEERLIRWMLLLEELHDAVVPPENRVEGYRFASADFWDPFLSGCLLFDPPGGELLAFADHPVASYGDYLNPLDQWADGGADGPRMLAPPIRFIHNGEELLRREQERHRELLDRLHRRLEPVGVDVWELVYDLEYWSPSRPTAADDDLPPRPYIDVRPRPLKPRRDRLTAVQCAVWYDALAWSHERIAERFDWAVQRPAGVKPRSETVRQHVAEGRELLAQRSAAA